MTVEIALIVALIVASVSWLAFSICYMIRARWWKNPYGWNVLGASTVFTIMFTRLAILVVEPDFKSDLRVTGFVIYVLAAVVALHRIYLLDQAQRSPKDKTEV